MGLNEAALRRSGTSETLQACRNLAGRSDTREREANRTSSNCKRRQHTSGRVGQSSEVSQVAQELKHAAIDYSVTLQGANLVKVPRRNHFALTI